MNVIARQKQLVELPIAGIRTDGIGSIREFYQPETLEGLKQSISEEGVLQPIVVSQEEDGSYDLVIGSRRIKSSQRAGKESIPAIIIKGLDDKAKLIMALSENIHHEDLTPFEEARVMLKLLNEYGMGIKELSTIIGRSESAIRNRIKLLKLPPSVQDMVSQQLLRVSTVNILESLKSPEDQERFAKITVDNALNAQELAALVKHKADKKRRRPRQAITGKKAQLKIYLIISSIERLIQNVEKAGMNRKDRTTITKALARLRGKMDGWIEKLNTQT